MRSTFEMEPEAIEPKKAEEPSPTTAGEGAPA